MYKLFRIALKSVGIFILLVFFAVGLVFNTYICVIIGCEILLTRDEATFRRNLENALGLENRILLKLSKIHTLDDVKSSELHYAEVMLKDVTPFDWDTMCVIEPNAVVDDELVKNIKNEYEIPSKLWQHVDSFGTILFLREGKRKALPIGIPKRYGHLEAALKDCFGKNALVKLSKDMDTLQDGTVVPGYGTIKFVEAE